MRKDIYRFLTVPAAGLFFCGMALAQQSSAPSTQQPSSSKPATTAPKKTTPAAAPKPKPFTLDNDTDKASYAIGLNIGRSMKKDGVEVNAEALTKGIKDAIGDGKALLTDEEITAVLTKLQADVRKHQQETFNAALTKNKEEGDAFLAANKAKPDVTTLPDGLQYKILQAGDGPKPTAADNVVCNYRGTLIDGTEFDSSYKRGKPATFGVSQVIKGWTEALLLMPVGSKWQIYIPSNLAYGERGTQGGPIGPNATLIFDLELVSIQPKPTPKLESVPPSGVPQPQAAPQDKPQAAPQTQPQPKQQ